MVTSQDPHGADPEAFLEEVHSFEFWFQAVEGYLHGHPYGHVPHPSEPSLPDSERETLIATLCNYCVGETAALEGASGMISFAPNRRHKIFLATQVADEARHVEVLLRRLRDLGVEDPEAEVDRRANRRLLTFRNRLLKFVYSRDLGGRPVRPERDPRVRRVHRVPGPRAHLRSDHARDPGRLDQGRAPTRRLRRERARTPARSLTAVAAPPPGDPQGARPACVAQLRRDRERPRNVGPPAPRSRAGLPRRGRTLGVRLVNDPLQETLRPEAPRKRYDLDDTDFDEVPVKYRRFYRRWQGRGGFARPQRGPLSSVPRRHPLHPRAARR